MFFTRPLENIQTKKLWKILELQKISKKIFLSKFVFFTEAFLGKKCSFLTIIFSKNFLLLSRPLHCIKVICTEKLSEKIQMPKMVVAKFFQQFSPKRMVQIRNGRKWLFQIFFDNFSQKDIQIQNDQKWLFQIFSDNFPQKDIQIQNDQKWLLFQIFSNNFSQKDWYKFGRAKNGCCSKFFPTIFPKKTGIN